MKSRSLKSLDDELWALTRQIIFLRHGNDCYTCHRRGLQGRDRQGGHFVPQKGSPAEIRFHLDNVRPQCAKCNGFRQGRQYRFGQNLKRDGLCPDWLEIKNDELAGVEYGVEWYRTMINKYKKILARLRSIEPTQTS